MSIRLVITIKIIKKSNFAFNGFTALVGQGQLLLTFRNSTQTHHTWQIPLDERSAQRRDLYLITHNTHKPHTSTPFAGFEHAIPASERPQTHALDHATL
jgi:hypothetical protein